MQKRIIPGVVFLLLAGMLLTSGCAEKTGDGTPNATATPKPGTTIIAPVRSSGQIVAEGEVVPIHYAGLNFPSSGIIKEVLVDENQPVKAGDVIARQDGKERAEAAVAAAELAILTAQQGLDELHKNAGLKRSNAQLTLANAEKEYDLAKEDREKLGLRWGDQNSIDRALANLVIANQNVTDAEKNFEDYAAWRPEEDPIRANFLSMLAVARANQERAQAQLEYVKGAPDELELNKADSRVEVAKASMDKARKDWEKVKESGIDPDDLSLAEANLKNAKATLESAKKALADLELKAPFDGVVVSNNLKVGEVVISTTASQSSAQVTLADTSSWKVETTDLTELSVVGVKEGGKVKLTFDAIPDLELVGHVERIKSLGINKQGDITYTVIINLDQQDKRLRWKMTAFATFETEE